LQEEQNLKLIGSIKTSVKENIHTFMRCDAEVGGIKTKVIIDTGSAFFLYWEEVFYDSWLKNQNFSF
jgi:hypothetical protein